MQFLFFCLFFYTKSIYVHPVHNSTIPIPPSRFGIYVVFISEYNKPSYLKHIQTLHIY